MLSAYHKHTQKNHLQHLIEDKENERQSYLCPTGTGGKLNKLGKSLVVITG